MTSCQQVMSMVYSMNARKEQLK